MSKFINLTDEQIEDVIFCIETYIIKTEESNVNGKLDDYIQQFIYLREDIVRQLNLQNGN
ncbi:hypothetical protein SCRM01_159c [Synechococcus phage S-CRM01]|uniref:hypothetical protein n=1 Tax=Synechococcus phage S-CRM01 TaxID=1026955 RepID=UPI000209E3F0|nr:hypothetical protein SCRM01_159c [Synechococcus phage S-CRM01]AEC53105.1 hypothetical protein SCRM01_159c [Synechococcus phage S-CRM01]